MSGRQNDGLRRRGQGAARTGGGFAVSQDDHDDDDRLLGAGTDKSDPPNTPVGSPGRQPERRASAWEPILTLFSSVASTLRGWFGAGQKPTAPVIAPSADATAALGALDQLAGLRFKVGDPEHGNMLSQIWELLQPGVAYAREGSHWSDIGFQGKDPVTDLRGQGMLGLHNLLAIARYETEAARQTIAASLGCPLAIAAINVSAALLKLLNDHKGYLGNDVFYQTRGEEQVLAVFNELFCMVFLAFIDAHRNAIERYLRGGGNRALAIMQFNQIKAEFFEDLSNQVANGRFIDSYAVPSRTRATARCSRAEPPQRPEPEAKESAPAEQNLISFE